MNIMNKLFFILLVAAYHFLTLDHVMAQAEPVPHRGGIMPPSESVRKAIKAAEDNYKALLSSLASNIPKADRIVVKKIDNCNTSDVQNAVINVWNHQYSQISSGLEITNSSDRVVLCDAIKSMLTNVTEFSSSCAYHFPSHEVSFFKGASNYLTVSISLEDNSFLVTMPGGGRVCRFMEIPELHRVEKVIPFSEYDQAMISRKRYEQIVGVATNVILSKIDQQIVEIVIKEFLNTVPDRDFTALLDRPGKQFLLTINISRTCYVGDWLGETEVRRILSSSFGDRKFAVRSRDQGLDYNKYVRLELNLEFWGPAAEGKVIFQFGYLAGQEYDFEYRYDGTAWKKVTFRPGCTM
jgi:hypothetical protein